MQVIQNKCMRFFLQLGKMGHIYGKEFETLNGLPKTKRFYQCINSAIFKYFTDQFSDYLNGVFKTAL